MNKKHISYADAGVDIDKSDRAKRRIKTFVKSTYNKNVLLEFGSFGGMFSINSILKKNPVLVSSVDGVGTKLKVAVMAGVHNTVGADLVHHCINDILVQGARPLFFMDYIACGKMDANVIVQVVSGLSAACRNNGTVLLGGETAEMPGMYAKNDYDLAGTIVGWVDRRKIIDGTKIKPGDVMLGLASAGLHTNGYSLARKLFFEIKKLKVNSKVPELGSTVGEALLKPHKCYLNSLDKCLDHVSGLCHITGGGFTGNIPRILPENCDAMIEKHSWPVLPVFEWIQRAGNVDFYEMQRTFNMGIGMIVIASKKKADKLIAHLKSKKEKIYVIGEITKGEKKVIFK